MHDQRFHSAPGCGGCAPSCCGSCSREPHRTQVTSNLQAPIVNQGFREPQTGEVTQAIDCRLLNLDGIPRNFWTCRSCGIVSRNLGTMATHVMEVHGLPSHFQCYKCGNSFVEERDWRRHLELVHYNNHQMLPPGSTGLEEPVMCHVCGVLYPKGRSFLSHAEICHTTNYSAASQPHTLTNSTNVCRFPGRSNDCDFLKEVIRDTLIGDY